MAVEIKELIIRASVDSERSCRGDDHSDSTPKKSRRINDLNLRMEQLAHMINQKNER